MSYVISLLFDMIGAGLSDVVNRLGAISSQVPYPFEIRGFHDDFLPGAGLSRLITTKFNTNGINSDSDRLWDCLELDPEPPYYRYSFANGTTMSASAVIEARDHVRLKPPMRKRRESSWNVIEKSISMSHSLKAFGRKRKPDAYICKGRTDIIIFKDVPFKIYFIGKENCDKCIIFITDIFGWNKMNKNAFRVCDILHEKTGFNIIMPDFFGKNKWPVIVALRETWT